jgi:Dolichyl-phosphate-mannose-protein mannosyltransferase
MTETLRHPTSTGTAVDDPTVNCELDPALARLDRSRPGVLDHPRAQRVRIWLEARWASLALALPLLAIAAIVRAINLGGSPQRVDDEGTYTAQAYTVSRLGELTHYTYWYDHPPLGWIQMAAWDRLTGAFDRYDVEVLAQREFMVVASVVSAALLFVLARRLHMSRWAAATAVAIFALSPLAVQYQRTVFLDNVATPWLLAALVLALAPRRQLAAFAGAAACFAIAVLSKETYLLFLPCVGWLMWSDADRGTRRYSVSLAGAIVAVLGSCYILMAALKGELVPGSDRASLVTGVHFQLVGRPSSGSVLDAGSDAHATVGHWMLDPAILVAGTVAAVLLLGSRRFAPVASAAVLALIVGLRPGYLPAPYVIGLLPFFAITIPALVEVSIRAALASSSAARRWLQVGVTGVVGVAAIAVTAPIWAGQAADLVHADHDRPMRQAEDYVQANVSRDSRLIVDDAMWLELVEAGFERPKVVWFYKVDTDPDVTGMAPSGWRDYDWVVSTNSVRDNLDSSPIVAQALANSTMVASFGEGEQAVSVHRVLPEGAQTIAPAEGQAR